MANRKPATPTQVRRVLTSLGSGASIRSCAESYRLSEFVIRKIKAGTYHVKPELNKYEERLRPERTKAWRRKDTSLPEDYRRKDIAARDASREAIKAAQQARKAAAQGHPFPEARRLLEAYMVEPQLADPDGSDVLREVLYPSIDPDDFAELSGYKSFDYQVADVSQFLQDKYEARGAGGMRDLDGNPVDGNVWPAEVWRGYYLKYKEKNLEEYEKLKAHFEATYDFVAAMRPEDAAPPRWIERGRKQLGRWHKEEATGGTIIKVGAQKLWINDQIERETKLPGMSASELMTAIRKDDAIKEPQAPEPKEEPPVVLNEQGEQVNPDGTIITSLSDILVNERQWLEAFPPSEEKLQEYRTRALDSIREAARAWWRVSSKSDKVFDLTGHIRRHMAGIVDAAHHATASDAKWDAELQAEDLGLDLQWINPQCPLPLKKAS